MNPPTPPRPPRIFPLFVRLTLLAFLALAALLISLWIERRISLTLPAPTGPLAVGRVIYDWSDPQSPDPLAPTAGTARELLVWIWYPANPSQSSVQPDYLPTNVRAAVQATTSPIFQFLTRDLSKVHAHAIPNASISSQDPTYPVLILRAGASAEVRNYSTLAEDLASHGYIVVGFDAPYRTFVVPFPDGRVIRRAPQNNAELCEDLPPSQKDLCVNRVLSAWLADIAFTLDRLQHLNSADPSGKFHGRLALDRVGLFGHSFGGAAVTQFCHDDPRCKAAVDIDGQPFGTVIQSGLRQPFMFLMSDHTHESDPDAARIMANIQSIYDHLPPNARFHITIRGANHFLFSDDSALLKNHLVMRALRLIGALNIDGPRQLAITTYALRTFFDAYLKSPNPAPPNFAAPQYSELQIQ